MRVGKMIFKVTFLLALFSSFVMSSQAISGTRTFTQPDGTKFEGILKGDSAFHWIESNGEVVIYNPKDKFYYKAVIDVKNGLMLSSEKPEVKVNRAPSVNSSTSTEHKVTKEERKNLYILYKKSRTGNYPR